MTTLHDAVALARDEQGLAVLSTLRANGTIQSSLVNAGILAHPATATFRDEWVWATVEGRAELAGPDDPPTLAGRRRTPAAAAGDLHRRRRRTRRLGRLRPGDGRAAPDRGAHPTRARLRQLTTPSGRLVRVSQRTPCGTAVVGCRPPGTRASTPLPATSWKTGPGRLARSCPSQGFTTHPVV